MQAVGEGLLEAEIGLVGVGQAGVARQDGRRVSGEGGAAAAQAARGVEGVGLGHLLGQGFDGGVVADAGEIFAGGAKRRVPLHGAARDLCRRGDDVAAHGDGGGDPDVGRMHAQIGEQGVGYARVLGDDQARPAVVGDAQPEPGAIGNHGGRHVGNQVGDLGGDGAQAAAGGDGERASRQ